jgi:peptide/nickel transport system substrate-binding protein
MFVFSYGGTMSSSAFPLAAILHTNDPAARMGQLNRARYSIPAFGAALHPALAEFDADRRNALLAAATRIGMEDFGILPLYWQKLYWAARKGFGVTPDRGESTSVLYVGPAK